MKGIRPKKVQGNHHHLVLWRRYGAASVLQLSGHMVAAFRSFAVLPFYLTLSGMVYMAWSVVIPAKLATARLKIQTVRVQGNQGVGVAETLSEYLDALRVSIEKGMS